MSEWDEMDFDGLDEELTEAIERDPDELQPEDIFQMVMINRTKNTRVEVEIRDQDGDTVHLPDLVAQILNYVSDKLQEKEGNEILDQLMPMVSQSLVSGLGRMMGISATGFLLTNSMTRTSLINMMVVALLLLKFIQENNLTIFTREEEVSQEEVNELERKARASNIATVGSMVGMDPRSLLREMVNQGQLTKQDLTDLIGEEDDNDGDKGSN